MALLDGLLHCYTPSLGPTGYRLIDRGPRRIHGVADTGVTSSMWAGSFNRWCLRGTAAASQRFSGCGTFPTGDRTVMVWWRAQVTIAQFTSRAAFFQGAQVTGQSFHLTIFHDASGVTGAMLGQWGDAVTVPFGNDGRWHCVVAQNTGTSYEIFVDGVSRGTKTMATTQTTTPPEIFGASGVSFWDGDLGEIAWWNRLLRPAETMELFREGDGSIGRMLTGQAFPRHRVSQAVAGGAITNTLTVSNATLNLTGQSSSLILSRKLLASNGSLNLAGQTSSLSLSRSLSTTKADLNISGQSSLLQVARLLSASNGTIEFSGQSADLRLFRNLSVNNASLSLSGQSATIYAARSLTVDHVDVNLSGQVVTLSAGKTLTVNNGEIQFVGQQVILTTQRNLTIVNTDISLSGQSVSMKLTTQQNLTVSNASIEIQGQQVTLRLAKSLVVLPAEIQSSGQTAQLTVTRKLAVQNGDVDLAGQDVMVRRRFELGIGEGQVSFSGEGIGLLSSRKILATEGRVQFSGQAVQIYPTFQNPVQIFGGNLRFIDKTTGSLRFIQEITR